MRIGVNLLFLVPGEVGGSEPLLTNLVEAVAARADHELVVFAQQGFGRSYPAIRAATELVEAPWSQLSTAQGARILGEHSWLPLQVRRHRLDVLHHGVGTTPFLKTVPTVVTVHDVQYLHYPANFSPLKRSWLRVNLPQAVRRSEVTAVTSRFVEQDVVSSYGLAPERVAIVPFGSERLFGPVPTRADVTRERYRLDRPYFLFPGRSYAHKNHRFLIEAYAPLAAQADLVLTGPPWSSDSELAAVTRDLGLTGKVRHLGLVPRADLFGLYAGAAGLTYPSRFEGFGAPVLEAWSAGCPVVSSDATALPEVIGDAGVLLDPDDLAGWSAAMADLLAGGPAVERLVALGTARAGEFSWERAAAAQVEAYERARERGAAA